MLCRAWTMGRVGMPIPDWSLDRVALCAVEAILSCLRRNIVACSAGLPERALCFGRTTPAAPGTWVGPWLRLRGERR